MPDDQTPADESATVTDLTVMSQRLRALSAAAHERARAASEQRERTWQRIHNLPMLTTFRVPARLQQDSPPATQAAHEP